MIKHNTFGRGSRVLTLYAVVFAVFLYLPILLIPLFSFNDGIYVKFPLNGFTLRWYVDLGQRATLHRAFWNSVQVGLVVCVVATVLAVPAAKALSRYRMPGKPVILGFMMLPLVVPGLILGVALLSLLKQFGVTLSLVTVGVGHVCLCVPYAISTLMSRFDGYDRAMEEASADLGENAWWTFWRVTCPAIAPGIVASLLMSFTVSFDEFFLAFFLSGTEATLPMYIWTQLRFPQDFPALLALATLVLVISFAMVFASLRIAGLGRPVRPAGMR